jgi:hypothetical protein
MQENLGSVGVKISDVVSRISVELRSLGQQTMKLQTALSSEIQVNDALSSTLIQELQTLDRLSQVLLDLSEAHRIIMSKVEPLDIRINELGAMRLHEMQEKILRNGSGSNDQSGNLDLF